MQTYNSFLESSFHQICTLCLLDPSTPEGKRSFEVVIRVYFLERWHSAVDDQDD